MLKIKQNITFLIMVSKGWNKLRDVLMLKRSSYFSPSTQLNLFIIFFYLYWIRHFGVCILYFAQLWNWQEYIHICNGCRPALPPTQYQDYSFNTPLMHILVQLLLPRSKIVIYCRHYVGIYNIHTVLTRYQRAWPWS